MHIVSESWVFFSRGAVVTTPLCKRSCPFKYSCSNFLNVHMDRRGRKKELKLEVIHTHTHTQKEGGGVGGGDHRILNNTAAASWILHLQRGEGC